MTGRPITSHEWVPTSDRSAYPILGIPKKWSDSRTRSAATPERNGHHPASSTRPLDDSKRPGLIVTQCVQCVPESAITGRHLADSFNPSSSPGGATLRGTSIGSSPIGPLTGASTETTTRTAPGDAHRPGGAVGGRVASVPPFPGATRRPKRGPAAALASVVADSGRAWSNL